MSTKCKGSPSSPQQKKYSSESDESKSPPRSKHSERSRKRRTKSRSRSRERSHHKHSSRHQHRRSRSRDRKRSHRDHHRSRRSRSRSRDRHSHKDRHSPRKSKYDHRRRSRSRSKEPRHRSRSPEPMLGAMAAQEKLANRMEKAKQIQRVKERRGDGDSNYNRSRQEERMRKYEQQQEAAKAALEKAGVKLPSYYNPLAVNPLQIAAQQEKRKKLWAKKETPEVVKKDDTKTALWSKMNFGDNKANEKFAKLMGIKDLQANKSESSDAANELIKKQQDIFKNLDQQYMQARITTHTQRGIGLGFTTNFVDPNTAPQSMGTSAMPPPMK